MDDTKCICAAGPKTPVRNVYQILIAGKKEIYLVNDSKGNKEAYTRCARSSNEDGYCTQHLKKIKNGGKVILFNDIKKKGVLATETHPYFKNFLKKHMAQSSNQISSNIPPQIRQIFNDKSGDEWVLKVQQELTRIAQQAIDKSKESTPTVCIMEDSEDEDEKINEIENEIAEAVIAVKKDEIRKKKHQNIEEIIAKNGTKYYIDTNVFDIYDEKQNLVGELKIVSDKYKKKSSIIYHNTDEDKDCNAIIAVKEEYNEKSYYRCIINNYVYDIKSHKHVGHVKDDVFIPK